MNLTPIDVQQQAFDRRLRGYDCEQVRLFLEAVALQLTGLCRELSEGRQQARQQQRELTELRQREGDLKATMMTAQRAVDDLRQQAEREADIIRRDAELRAEKILLSAQQHLGELAHDSQALKLQRARLLEELRGVLSTHARLLDVHAADAREPDLPRLAQVLAPPPPRAPQSQD